MMLVPVPVIWLVIGGILIAIEFVTMGSTGLIAEVTGFCALLIAGFSLVVPFIPVQVILWLILSVLAVWYSRRFIPKGQLTGIDNQEGRIIAEIKEGTAGRVKFEGQSWRAICADPDISIPAGTEVLIMEHQGTTLVVMPKNWLKSDKTS